MNDIILFHFFIPLQSIDILNDL